MNLRSLIAIIIFCIPSFASINNINKILCDGIWWKSLPTAQRVAFLDGYTECLINYIGEKSQINGPDSVTMEQEISNYFNDNNRLKEDVISVFLTLSKKVKKITPAGSGENTGLDGEYWRELMNDERLGFIEGFLRCEQGNGSPNGSFLMDSSWYVDKISEWYGIDSKDPSAINAKKSEYKVGDVLCAINVSGSTAITLTPNKIKK